MKRKFTNQFLCAMLFFACSAQAQDSLFISEVTDPADDYTGRFIELYNAGSEDIDFSTTTCYLSRQSNGGTSWGDLQLSGTVAAGATLAGTASDDGYPASPGSITTTWSKISGPGFATPTSPEITTTSKYLSRSRRESRAL